ncbi:MAG: glycosyltransferase family 39 protein [candidate division Zixibacteria bacterium]|nr:glycosyltransferase family 39 protein [candidate division Zixibacteria bacterium]
MKNFLAKNRWPLIIALAAIVVRLFYLVELSNQPGFSVPMVDEKWHWLWAQEILDKSFWGEGSYFRGPLYPYLLAFLYFITDASIFWAKFLQILICGLTAAFIFKIGRRLFNETVGLISGFAYVFYGTLVFYETMFLIPVLFLFFLVWGMSRLIENQDSSSLKSWVITGLIFGLAAITRPNIIIVVPFLALWLFFRQRQPPADWKISIRPALVLVAGMFLAIAPVTIRNYAVTGDIILISSQGGINLYLGNNEVADGLTMIMPEVELSQSITWDMFIPVTSAAAERELGRELTDAEVSSFWTGKAVGFVFNNPTAFLGLVWKKSVYLLSGFENSDASDIYYQRKKSVLYSLLVWDNIISFPFGLLLPLVFLSLFVLRHDFRKLLPLYIFILAYIPSIVLFLVSARHRLPLVPFLIVIAGAGVYTLFKSARKFTRPNLILALTIFAAAVITFNIKFYDLGIPNPFQIHFNDGLTHYRLGDYKKAEQAYLLADKTFPYSSALLVNLAEVQMKLDKNDNADRILARALSLNPRLAMAHNNLGVLVQSKGDLDSARILFRNAVSFYNKEQSRPNELGEYYINLAGAMEKRDLIDSAAWAFKQALINSPLYPRAFLQAGAFFARNGMYELSDATYVEAMHVQPLGAVDLYNWGLSYVQREMYNDGMGLMRRALRKDHELHPAYYVIAAVYRNVNEPKDSVKFYLQKCLDIEPDYEPALSLMKELEN